MKAMTNWLVWKEICRKDDKPTKVPFQPSGDYAKSQAPDTWSSFDAAAKAAPRYSGIGFAFPLSREMTGVDLDGCRDKETGKIEQWAVDIIRDFDTYAEVSPSGTGAKLFCFGKLPVDSGRKVDLADVPTVTQDKKPGIEVYDQKRYFAVTGRRLAGMPHEPQSRQEKIDALWHKYFHAERPTPTGPMDILERARRYVSKMPPAVSGQSGHNTAFHVACVLVIGFDLTSEDALTVMHEYNERCKPPWSERELLHKVNSASKQPGERGFLAKASDSQLRHVKLPEWKAEPEPEVKAEPKRVVTLQDAAIEYCEHVESGADTLVDLAVGDVNHALGGGVAYGEMIIVAARPSHGKTAFALQCLDTATTNELPAAMVSEEMSALALGKRTIQFAVDTPEEHWRHELRNVQRQLANHFGRREPCYVVESCREPEVVSREVRKLVNDSGVKVVAVDYAQLLASKGKTRYEQITHTSIVLRQLANELKIVLLVLCQMSRAIEGRNRFVPQMSDLRETGQLEQDADVILFLVWPHRIDPKKDPREYQVFIAKNRNRPINTPAVECEFRPSRQMVVEHKVQVADMGNHVPEFDEF